jgi:MFS family permease
VEFEIDFAQVSLLTGYQLATVAAVAFIMSAIACKFGKRGPFIFSLALLLSGTIWCASSRSYASLLGGRIVQGLGAATFESITYALVGDLYFVHERGSRMAIYVVAQTGLVLIPSLIAGKVAEDLGWRWMFWILAIFLGIGLIGVIFVGWETAYNRNAVYNIDTSSQNNIEIIENLKSAGPDHIETIGENLNSSITRESSDQRVRLSFLRRMKPYSRIYSEVPFWKLLLRPFIVAANPIILWAIIIVAFSQLWNVCISFVLAQIFSPPPYSLNPAGLGYISAGPCLGGIIGCFACGYTSDRICRAMAKRNGGVYEPEFRLILMSFVPIFAGTGYFLFGNMAQQGKSPIAMSAIWGILFVSVQLVGHSTGAYLVDAFRNTSIEIFVISMSIKNFLFFGFSCKCYQFTIFQDTVLHQVIKADLVDFLNDWLALWGPAKVFDLIGGVMLALCATTIPVYIFGKRMRGWWHTSLFIRNL